MEKQRFQFPSNWLYADNVDGEWGAFNEILKRKDSSIQTQVLPGIIYYPFLCLAIYDASLMLGELNRASIFNCNIVLYRWLRCK